MDTSDEYAKMCEKAEEIQKTWLLRDGDILYSKKFKTCWGRWWSLDLFLIVFMDIDTHTVETLKKIENS